MTTIAGISDEAVEKATGEPWAHWLEVLDAAEGTDLDHKERVAHLKESGVESPWWQQQLAVGYEQARNLREVGETADTGFQLGAQRTLNIPQSDLWALLTEGEARDIWLGETDSFDTEPGTQFETADGTSGEIRTVSAGERIRLTWQPEGRDEPTTLQLTVSCPRNDESKTTLRIHHEKLADAAERDAMREHWQSVLDQLETMVG